jgi:hypothetical protein
METITLKTAPEISKIVKAAFPAYKKQKVFLSVFSPKSINTYWDGGSRDEYALVDLSSMRTKSLPTSTHPFFDVQDHGLANTNGNHVTVDHVGNITLNAIPEGFALVSAGTFCGKPATAHVRLHPNNMPRMLTQ